MTSQNKQNLIPVKALDQKLIDRLYKELTKELGKLIKELNDSSKMGAYGAMATLSVKVSEMAKDLKQLQRLPAILTDPKVTTDPRKTLEEISKKYSKKHL